jgi:hypothetical protein
MFVIYNLKQIAVFEGEVKILVVEMRGFEPVLTQK